MTGKRKYFVNMAKAMFLLSLFLLYCSTALLLFCLVIPSFAAETQPQDAPQPAKKIVVRVNGVELTEEDLREEIGRIIPQATYHGAPLRKKAEEFREQALQSLILQEIKYQEARRQKIKVRRKDIEKDVNKIKERFKGEDFEEVLKKNNMTIETVKGKIERRLMVEALEKKIDKELKKRAEKTVTKKYLLDYYENNKEKFVQPERMRLREILIRIDPGGGQKNWDEAKAKAEEIMKRAKEGEDFAKLAREYSEDEYAAKGGDMGLVHKGSVMPEIEHVASELKVGEIGGPVWTLYGYHIVRLEELAPPIQMEYKEVKDRLKLTLREKEYWSLKSNWINGLKEGAKIEIVK